MIKVIHNPRTGFQCWFAAYIQDKTLESVEKIWNTQINPEEDFRTACLCIEEDEDAQEAFNKMLREGWIEFEEDEECIVVKFLEDGSHRDDFIL